MILLLGYLDSTEIQVMMSLLKIIDNPINDIAIVTVLRSMIGGFNDNELIEMRVGSTDKTFYESMIIYKDKKEANSDLKLKIENFLEKIERLRKSKDYMPLNEFIWKIYLDTGYYSYVSLMPNGNLRAGNLKMLFEKAKQYEKTSFKGLYNFISFIDKLKLSSNDMAPAKLIGENEDVVRIMSIHKSKGLEFPVVFLSGTSKRFNMQDLNKNDILLHGDLGFGPKYVNYEEGETYTTLAMEAIKIKSKLELISEEMRVLYVALTRAKEKLIITGIEKDYAKEIAKKEEILDSYAGTDGKTNINKNIIQKALSYLDWIEFAYLKRKKDLEEILEINTYKGQEFLKEKSSKDKVKEADIEDRLKDIDTQNTKKLKEKLEWKYEYNELKNVLTKTSVTGIKNMKLNLEEKEFENYNVPEFLKKNKELTGAEKGSLMHLVLQKLDEKIDYDKNKIMKLVEELEERKIINEKQKEAIDIDKVFEFTKSNIWKELKTAKEVEREKPFYINISVKEIYGEDIDENVLVQGIIDLYYITNKGEIVLVDYKTDRVKEEKELVTKYKEQLEIYKRALEKALGKKVGRVYIYSSYLDKEIKI